MVVSLCLLHARGSHLGWGWPPQVSRRQDTDRVVGIPASYGIFQEYYSDNDFAGSSNIAVVGACAMVSITPVLREQDCAC
jgi:hypothetical protein